MRKVLKVLLATALVCAFFVSRPATVSYAYSTIPDFFDFGDSTMSIDAGGSRQMWLRATYNYSYYVVGATSSSTYIDCAQHSGTETVTIHIGPDEQAKNVFFYFYVRDDKIQETEKYDVIEVYVQNIQQTKPSVPVNLAKGEVGSLRQNDKVSMLYNSQNTPMASFSLSRGDGQMAPYVQNGILTNNGAAYFQLTCGYSVVPVISASDKAVMLANGIAGVYVNGRYMNWP